MSAGSDAAAHWDDAYADGEDANSWFQAYPAASLSMLDAAGVITDDSVIDVGGGASNFADALLCRGFRDVTVLDISGTGLRHAQQRLGGARAQCVQWIVADLLAWRPPRRYRVWHDRAVFHFLTSPLAQSQYLDVLDAATEPASVAVFGLFAPDGPQRCSGLPVARYSATTLAGRLGDGWRLIREDREEHTTPAGRIQPFTWAAFRKQPVTRSSRGRYWPAAGDVGSDLWDGTSVVAAWWNVPAWTEPGRNGAAARRGAPRDVEALHDLDVDRQLPSCPKCRSERHKDRPA